MYDLLIIGGGPAALSAASFALGKGISFALLYSELGGKVGWPEGDGDPDRNIDLPGRALVHRLGQELTIKRVETIRDHALSVTKHERVYSVATERHGILTARTVIVATGASPVRLDVPGEDRLFLRGLGYSAATHTRLAANRPVAVVGATMRALAGAAELARTAKHVYLIAPHTSIPEHGLGGVLRVRPNVELLDGYKVLKLVGDTTLKEIVVKRGDEVRRLPVERVFVSLGLQPNSELVHDLVETDAKGYIEVDDYFASSEPGLFAAGDVTTPVPSV